MPVFKPIEYKEPAPGEGLYKTAQETEKAMAALAEKIKKRKKEQPAPCPEHKKIMQKPFSEKLAGDKMYLLKIKLEDNQDTAYIFQKLFEEIEAIRAAGFMDEGAVQNAQLARYILQNFIIFGLHYKPRGRQ